MKLKNLLIYTFIMFCIITTAQMIFRVFHVIFFLERDSHYTSVLVIALASSLPLLIFTNSDNDSKKKFTFRLLLHFLLTAVIVTGLLFHYHLNMSRTWDILGVAIVTLFFVIYAVCFFGYFYYQKRVAKKLNARLIEFQKENK